MNTSDFSQYQKIASQIALESGEILLKYWGKIINIEEKKFAWDLVTEADKESEKLILEKLQNHFPSHTILSEEAGLSSPDRSEFIWVVDPLDGTTNYTHQYPMVCISIGLLYQNTPMIGVVYNPILNEMFEASYGNGTTLNHQPIHVSKVKELHRSLLATGFAYDRKETADNNYAEFCHITNNSQGVRRGGSAALDLAYVAAGRLDGFWERGLQPWDIAAGIVLITEAGGQVSSYEGKAIDLNSGRILASNGLIHDLMIQELSVARQHFPGQFPEKP